MMKHEDIRKLLSAYCGGDLSPAERAWVDEHLSSCRSCRAELADLKTTLRMIKSTPAVEAPPWLTSRIMSHIVEQPLPERSWLQRLFFPRQTRLALEIMALLVICATGYYLTQESDSDLHRAVPQLQHQQQPPVPDIAAPQKETPAAAPAPVIGNKATEPPAKSNEISRPEKASSTPEPAARAKTAEPSAHHDSNDSNLSDSTDKTRKSAQQREKRSLESTAPASGSNSAASAPAIAPPRIRINLIMGLDSLSAKSVRQAVRRCGGSILPIEAARADRQLRTQIPASKLDDLFSQLEKLGRIVERPTVNGSAEIVEVDILW